MSEAAVIAAAARATAALAVAQAISARVAVAALPETVAAAAAAWAAVSVASAVAAAARAKHETAVALAASATAGYAAAAAADAVYASQAAMLQVPAPATTHLSNITEAQGAAVYFDVDEDCESATPIGDCDSITSIGDCDYIVISCTQTDSGDESDELGMYGRCQKLGPCEPTSKEDNENDEDEVVEEEGDDVDPIWKGSRICVIESCGKRSTWGPIDGPRCSSRFCAPHGKAHGGCGNVNDKRCKEPGCKRISPTFGPVGGIRRDATHCSEHGKPKGYVDIVHQRRQKCEKHANFGEPDRMLNDSSTRRQRLL